MANDVSVTFNGKPIEQLQTALGLMSKYMRYVGNEACVALAINVLRGLRTRTKIAKKKRKLSYNEYGDLRPSYYTQNGKHYRCFRHGNGRGARADVNGKIGNAYTAYSDGVRGKENWMDAKLYEVVVDETLGETKYILAAKSRKDAREYASYRYWDIIKLRGLAQTAVSLAMGQLGAVNRAPMTVQAVSKIAQSAVLTKATENSVSVSDNLRYATNALKNGASDIDAAITAATNKIIGNFSHRYKKIWQAAAGGSDSLTPQVIKQLLEA